ncbi:5-oxoprolinase subunit PxpA [Aureimonas populi]|uniref:5-oxoprolinase subunit PxpA n=2 Tax=Aureimonas populi TaxID=1701758 RepID=A0ABW5CRQ3_9HYPH
MQAVDINCDMGERFGVWRLGGADDAALMSLISSANIAAGFHAGDPDLIASTVALAVENGVAIGAHPGFPDLKGFGRRRMEGLPEEFVNDIVYQVGAVAEFARRSGDALAHVKPHGALYMELARSEAMSALFIDYMRMARPDTPIFCMDVSHTCRIAREAGHPVVREFFADRDYGEDGAIVFTRRVGALDPAAIADKVLKACREGRVTAVTGREVDIVFESVCFHSDTPGSTEIARAIRERLDGAGIDIRPVSQN